jgi:hypothetical protein
MTHPCNNIISNPINKIFLNIFFRYWLSVGQYRKIPEVMEDNFGGVYLWETGILGAVAESVPSEVGGIELGVGVADLIHKLIL